MPVSNVCKRCRKKGNGNDRRQSEEGGRHPCSVGTSMKHCAFFPWAIVTHI